MFTIDGIHRAVNTGYHEMLNAATEPNDRKSRLDEKLKRELGECVLAALADDRTEDVVLNPDSRLWLSRQGEGWVRIGELSPTQAQAAMGTVAAQKGTVINYDRPILETELPIDGSRFEAIVPPVASRPIFAIRQRPRRIFTLEDYERAEILTDRNDLRNRARIRSNFAESVAGLSHSDALRLAVRERKNILIVGSTGSGKTTLVNACLDLMAKVCPTDRVVSIEDTMELQGGIVVGIVLWLAAVAVLSRMGKADPMLRQVYIRHVKYRPFYAAKSGLLSQSLATPRRWR